MSSSTYEKNCKIVSLFYTATRVDDVLGPTWIHPDNSHPALLSKLCEGSHNFRFSRLFVHFHRSHIRESKIHFHLVLAPRSADKPIQGIVKVSPTRRSWEPGFVHEPHLPNLRGRDGRKESCHLCPQNRYRDL